MIGPCKRAVGACGAGIRIKIKKKSCVAATYRSDCVAATQLFIFDGGFEDLWPRAPNGALAIGYYSKRCSAAHLPLRGYFSKIPSYSSRGARSARPQRTCLQTQKTWPASPSAQPPKSCVAALTIIGPCKRAVGVCSTGIRIAINKEELRSCDISFGLCRSYAALYR